jgi:hypothetical protein
VAVDEVHEVLLLLLIDDLGQVFGMDVQLLGELTDGQLLVEKGPFGRYVLDELLVKCLFLGFSQGGRLIPFRF